MALIILKSYSNIGERYTFFSIEIQQQISFQRKSFFKKRGVGELLLNDTVSDSIGPGRYIELETHCHVNMVSGFQSPL